MRVEFYRHNLGDSEKRLVSEVLDSVFLTTGPRTRDFEARFADYLGASQCVGTTSCTMALFLVLKGLGIGVGDEVITSPMTFIATANAILHTGATPAFVDVEPDTGNLDASLLDSAITDRTKAIIPVHLYGQMCDMKAIREIADRRGVSVIEDAAHCVEGIRDGVRPGQLGAAACFSFYATKNIACGEGGAIVTNDTELADRLRVLRLHGMSKGAADRYTGVYQHWDMQSLGYKANMFDLQAALLLPQLERVEDALKRRETICRQYEVAFETMDGVGFPRVLDDSRSARHLFTIWVDPAIRDQTLASLQEDNIGVAVNFRAIHLLTYYRDQFGFERGNFPEAERIGDSTLSIPMYPKLETREVEYVIDSVRRAVSLR